MRGNMLADEAARGARERLPPDPSPRASFAAVRSWVTSRFFDPPLSSERVRAPVVRRPEMARKDSVLVAQLRSGHCYRLRAYRALVDPSVDPTCPLCQRAPHTLEHWLQVCEALSTQRLAAPRFPPVGAWVGPGAGGPVRASVFVVTPGWPSSTTTTTTTVRANHLSHAACMQWRSRAPASLFCKQ